MTDAAPSFSCGGAADPGAGLQAPGAPPGAIPGHAAAPGAASCPVRRPAPRFRWSVALGAARVAGHLLAGLSLALLFFGEGRGGDRALARRRERLATWWHGRLCRILGLRVTVHGQPAAGAVLYVANHVSWLDIIAVASLCPARFVAKSEVAAWPAVGWLVRRVGTLFVRRGYADSTAQVADQMTWRLTQGEPLLVFPEGTSSSGEQVGNFHPRLYQAAIRAQRPVQAVAVRYPGPDATPVHPAAPFVGDDEFLGHLLRVLAQGGLTVELHFCPPLASRGADRRELARATRNQIQGVLDEAAGRPAVPRQG